MAFWTDIRSSLSAAITGAFPGAQMSGYLGADGDSPFFEIDFPSGGITLDSTYGRGTDEVEIIVRGVVPLTDPVESQQALDLWLEPGSGVREAIHGMTRPTGVDDLRVQSINAFSRLSLSEKPNAVFLCHEWVVRLLLSY